MGLWSYSFKSLAPAGMTSELEKHTYCPKRASTNHPGSGPLGAPVARRKSMLPLRQHSSGPRSKRRFSQGPQTHEVVAHFSLYATVHNLIVTVHHLPGLQNSSADAISRANTCTSL